MTLSQLFKKSKKLVMSNPVEIAAATLKLWISPAIKTIAYEDKEVICLYIDA